MGVMKVFSGNVAKSGEESRQHLIEPKTTINFAYVSYAFLKGYRYCCLEGSSRSGKTWAILQWIVFACLEPKTFLPKFPRNFLEVRCMRHDATTARGTIWDDLIKILGTLGLENGSGYKLNQRDLVVEFPNGSKVTFGGASDPGKLHGLGSDIVFFNEAMMISRSAVDQMEMRTRVGFILDWNPSLNEHWIFKQGFDKISVYAEDEKMAGEPKCFYAHSTYKDNIENLTSGQISSIEQYEPTPGNVERGTANKHMWEIYGLGKRGYLEGRIIPPEKITFVEPDAFPNEKQWECHGYGLDFGFAIDPTALVECAIWDKRLYVRELIYEKKLNVNPSPTLSDNDSLIERLKELDIKPYDVIVADCSRPETISALKQAGYCVRESYKSYGGSIVPGINLMNERRWCVTDNSPNVKFELENWCWQTDRYGNQLGEPGKKHNHAMDAIRYWLTLFVDNANIVKPGYSTSKSKIRRYCCSLDLW